MTTELKKNITKGVGKGKFGTGLYKKDRTGLSFTKKKQEEIEKNGRLYNGLFSIDDIKGRFYEIYFANNKTSKFLRGDSDGNK